MNFIAKIKSYYLQYKEIILYIIVGAITTFINIAVFHIFSKQLQMHYLFANACAWIAAVLFAFYTNRKFVFESESKNVFMEFSKFVGARIFSGGIDMLIMYIGIDVCHINEFYVKILTNVLVLIINYVFSKLFIFKKRGNAS